MKPSCILLRPNRETIAAGIFDGDAFGGRPPTMFWSGRKWEGPGCTVAGVGAHRMAIVLAGEGEMLPIGVTAIGDQPPCLHTYLYGLLLGHKFADTVRRLLAPLGTLVVLDEHGREIE